MDSRIAENLQECVETGWVSTGGRFIGEFEKKVARYLGMNDAVACQSGTAGLHTALRILGVGAGQEVIVPAVTFIAAVNPVRYLGAVPVFMDCDRTLCMDPDKLEKFCREECSLEDGRLINKSTGRTVKAVIPVHVFGSLADMERIMYIAETYGLRVLEDASEALGSFWESGHFVGKHAGTVGHMGVYSFNANKIITTGGGGMIVSKHNEALARARYLITTAKNDPLYFVHDEVGYNYRMLNLQAAIGVSQIDYLEPFIKTKIRNYSLYGDFLEGVAGMRLLPFSPGVRANHWFYSLLIDDQKRRDKLMMRLIDAGVQCRPLWKLVNTQKAYRPFQAYMVERAPYYEGHILNIPCSVSLTEGDVKYVSEKIIKCAGP